MTLEGRVGKFSTKQETVIASGHSPVTQSGRIKQNTGIWAIGTVLTREGGLLCPWDGTGPVAGVLIEECDSDKRTSATYLRHGNADLAKLKKADGGPLTEEEVFKVDAAGIYGA